MNANFKKERLFLKQEVLIIQGVGKRIDKNIKFDLLITLIHSFKISLDPVDLYFLFYFWSVGPRRPSDQSNAIVGGWVLPTYLPACLVGFRPRVHGGHLAPSEVSCLKRQTTLR